MLRIMAALLAGILFGVGLTISQMINPQKVLAFLDLAGAWDPSLALVMVGALAVAGGTYPWIAARDKPVLAEEFQVPQRRDVDPRLVSGALIFGVGWGLVGYCPGPALASLSVGHPRAWVFVAAMLAGMLIYRLTLPASPAPVQKPLP